MKLSPEKQLCAAILDVLVSVSTATLERNAKAHARGESTSWTVVNPYALVRLQQKLEEVYPGALAKMRELDACPVCHRERRGMHHRKCEEAAADVAQEPR